MASGTCSAFNPILSQSFDAMKRMSVISGAVVHYNMLLGLVCRDDGTTEKPSEVEPLLSDPSGERGRRSEPIVPPPLDLYPARQGHSHDHSSQVCNSLT